MNEITLEDTLNSLKSNQLLMRIGSLHILGCAIQYRR